MKTGLGGGGNDGHVQSLKQLQDIWYKILGTTLPETGKNRSLGRLFLDDCLDTRPLDLGTQQRIVKNRRFREKFFCHPALHNERRLSPESTPRRP